MDLERASPLRRFFTGGIEYDDETDEACLEEFHGAMDEFLRRLKIPARWGEGVELKFRKLGRHRAEGLYYPEQKVLVVEHASVKSFVHEFGHLVDYRGVEADGDGPSTLSQLAEFRPYLARLREQMRPARADLPQLKGGKGRLTWSYFASPTECFARVFEQFAAEHFPFGSSLLRTREAYRCDALFFEALPLGLVDYFRFVLRLV